MTMDRTVQGSAWLSAGPSGRAHAEAQVHTAEAQLQMIKQQRAER